MSEKLKSMREANRITHELLQAGKRLVLSRKEITKEEIEMLAEIALTRNNVKSAFKGVDGYPSIICISVNDEIIHGLPNSTKIVKGDIVSLDFGVIVNGYYSDAAISFLNSDKILDPISKKRKLVRDTDEWTW